MIKNHIFILLCIALSISKIDAQSLLYKIPIEEQISQASLIIEGKVVDSKSYFSSINNRIYTINKIHVFRVFKGEELPYVNIVTKGGSIDLKKEEVKPSLQLRKGVTGVFMLEENSNQFVDFNSSLKIFQTYGDLQGFYKYDEYRNLVTSSYYSFTGIQDSFYEIITNNTKENKQLVDYSFSFEKQSKSLQTTNISSFEPQEVRAGTGQTITITGSNFGTTNGIIQFRNADNGGASFQDAFNSAIQSWTDTSITVRVPSFAGTGRIQIITDEGGFFQTDTDLTVLSAELNSEFSQFPEVDYRTKLYNSDRQGGYSWVFNNEFYLNSDAVDAFERAMDDWVCATGISWVISDNQSAIVGSNDEGINLVSFKSGTESSFDEIEPGILAVTTTYYLGCSLGDTVTSYVSEVDMTFNSDFNWYFGEDTNGIGQFENDFQGTTTHELGHAHNLGHVIAPSNLMHFETDSGPDSATGIDDNSIAGAVLNYEFSKTPGLCDEDAVMDRDCGDKSVIVYSKSDFVVIENPVRDFIKLAINEADALEYSFILYDMNGRVVKNEMLDNVSFNVDATDLNPGIYIAKVITGDDVKVQKIIKL